MDDDDGDDGFLHSNFLRLSLRLLSLSTISNLSLNPSNPPLLLSLSSLHLFFSLSFPFLPPSSPAPASALGFLSPLFHRAFLSLPQFPHYFTNTLDELLILSDLPLLRFSLLLPQLHATIQLLLFTDSSISASLPTLAPPVIQLRMSHSSNESEDGLHYTDQSGSLLVDEFNATSAGGVALKKGPWTSAEDAILVDYVKKHGEGNWNAVQKHSGLSRCGKSCRLRWANHLRPNLKKGAFTAEEEQLIIELHAKMGNKWARMAAHLPGRTDNEIKNYWNTRIKRRQRAGLPLYPPEVCLQALQAHREGQETGGLDNGDTEDYDMWKASYEYIPDAIFDRYTVNQEVLPYASELLKISPSNMMLKGYVSSQYCSFMAPNFHRQKRLRESTPLIPTSDECIKSSVDQFMDRTCDKIAQSFGSYFSFDPDPASKSTISLDVIQGDHSLSNGNSSASQSHIGNEKLELPSLQYAKTDLGSWETSSLPHISESVDAFIQFPSSNSMIGPDCLSQCNSGLLDALLHDANCACIVKDHSSGSNSSTLSPGNILHGSNLNFCEAEWKDYAEPPTPFGHSCAPLFTECTPISSSGSSFEEIPPAEPLSEFHNSGNQSTRSLVKTEPVDQAWWLEREKDAKTGLSFTRSDTFLAPEWLEQNSGFVNDLGMVVGEDLAADYKNVADGTSTSSSGWGLSSSWAWNNMTAVCQMTDLPQ